MERKSKTRRLVNMAVVKDYIEKLNPTLRVSKEFIEHLDALTRIKVERAVQRQKSRKGITLMKDPLYM
jgi:hypothetical protein